jgi:hypothetical protein
MLEQLIILNLPHPAKFSQGLNTPQQLLRSYYIFLFQLPLLPELVMEASDYEAITKVIQGKPFNKNAFTTADLAAYKDAAAKRGAITAMLNYYRNIFQQRLLKKKLEYTRSSHPHDLGRTRHRTRKRTYFMVLKNMSRTDKSNIFLILVIGFSRNSQNWLQSIYENFSLTTIYVLGENIHFLPQQNLIL